MVKMRQPRFYENWVKRKLMNPRILYNDMRAGHYYLMVVEESSDELGSYTLAPIIACTGIARGYIYGINISALPIELKEFRMRLLKEFREVSNSLESSIKFSTKFTRLTRMARSRQLRENEYYKVISLRTVKSRIVEVTEDEIENLTTRVI